MSASFFVKGDEHEEDSLGKFYRDYEMAEALTDFFKRVSTDESATITWNS